MIETAYAQSAGAPDLIGSMAPLVIIFVLMYFLVFRPQQKKAKEHQQLLNSLKRGDRVTTSGGIYGVISRVHETTVDLEVSEGVIISVARPAISSITMKDVTTPAAPAKASVTKLHKKKSSK